MKNTFSPPDRQLLRRDPNTPFVSIRPIFSAGGISYNLCITFSSKFSYHLIHDPLQMMHFIGSAVTTSQLNSPLYSFCSSVILNPHAYISYSENMHTINCGCHFSARRLHCCLIPSKILSASCWGNWSGRSPLTRSMTPGVLAMISSIIASVCCLLRPVISPCLIQWRRCIRYIW